MILPFHPHRSTRFSFAEHRMLFEQATPEVMRAMDILQTKKDETPEQKVDTEKQLADLVSTLDPQAQELFFQQLGEKVNTLPQIEKDQISANLRALAEKNAPPAGAPIAPENTPVDGTRSAVERLRQKIQVPAEKPAEVPVAAVEKPAEVIPAVPAPVERPAAIELPPLRVRPNNETAAVVEKPKALTTLEKINPMNWTKETWKNVAIGTGITVATGAVIATALSIWKWLKGTTETVVDKTKTGISWTTQTALIGGGLAAAGILGAIGISKASEFMKGFAKTHEEIRDGLALAQSTATNAASMAGAAMAGVNTAVQTAKEGIDDPRVVLAAATAQATEEIKLAAADAKKDLQKTAQKKEVKEVAQIGSEVLLVQYMMRFEDHPDIQWPEGTTARNHREKVTAVLHNMMNNPGIKMADIFACMQFGGVNEDSLQKLYPNLPSKSDESYSAYLGAVQLIVRSCAKRRKDVETVTGKDSTNMTLKEFLAQTKGANSAVAALGNEIEKHGLRNMEKWDVAEVLRSINEDPLLGQDLINLMKSDPRFEEVARRRDLPAYLENLTIGHIPAILTSLGLNPDVPPNEVRAQIAGIDPLDPNVSTDQAVAVLLVNGILKAIPSSEQLQPFFHDIFPDKDWVEASDGKISPENKAVIERYLNHDMSFGRTMLLAAYTRMIQRQNPAGVVLMQAEILKFIREKEEDLIKVGGVSGLKIRAWQAADNMATGVVDGRYLKELEDQFDISDAMKARIVGTFAAVAPSAIQEAAEFFAGGVLTIAEPVLAGAVNRPEISIPVLTLIAARFGWRAYTAFNDFRIERRDPDQLKGLLAKRSKDTTGARIKARLKLRIHPQNYANAKKYLDTVVDELSHLKGVDKALHDRLDKAFRDSIGRNGATDQAFEEFEKTVADEKAKVRLEKRGAAKSTKLDHLHKLETRTRSFLATAEDPARRAFRIAVHPFRGRIISHGIPLVGEALGAAIAIGYDLPAWYHYRNAENAAREQGDNPELADAYELQKNFAATNTFADGTSGFGYYFAQGKLASMPLARAGLLRGAPTALRAGPIGAMGVLLAVEALRIETQIILNNTEKDLADIAMTPEQARGMTREQLEQELTTRKEGSYSWGQWQRTLTLSRFINGDDFESLQQENEVVRENYFRGYVVHRLLQKARGGDPFAMRIARQMFDANGDENPGAKPLIEKYINYVQSDLQLKFGTRNDLARIKQQSQVEPALAAADLAASVRMDVDDCIGLIAIMEGFDEQQDVVEKELGGVEARYALSTDEEASALKEKRDELRSKIKEMDAKRDVYMDRLASYELMSLDVSGTKKSIFDLASERKESGKNTSIDAEDAAVLVPGYRDLNSEIIKAAEESPAEYERFLQRAQQINEYIQQANRVGGSWGYTPQHYEALQEYAYLLDAHPSMDEGGRVRDVIWRLPSIGWEQMPGKHPYEALFENTKNVIAENVKNAEGLRFKYSTPDITTAPKSATPYVIGRKEELYGITSRKVALTVEDQKYTFEGKPNAETSFETPLGKIVCAQNGKGDYIWSFEGKKPGKFHIGAVNEQGVEQPGTWMNVEEKTVNRIALKPGQAFEYPYPFFKMTLRLKNGTVIKDPDVRKLNTLPELNQYLTFEPLMTSVIERDGKRYKLSKPQQKGWKLIAKNPNGIESIELRSPMTTAAEQTEVLTFEPESEKPAEGPTRLAA